VTFDFHDTASDPATVRLFTTRALALRAGEGAEVGPWVDHLLGEIANGAVHGRLARRDGVPVGLVAWAEGGPLGANVHVLYADGHAATVDHYRALMEEAGRQSHGVAFAPGRLGGLKPDEEEALMDGLGFGPYGRSEMRLGRVSTLPAEPANGWGRVRPIVPEDEAELAALHQRAYHGRFDRYLFQEGADEAQDCAREIHQLLHGRWGELDAAGSVVLEADGAIVADVIAVVRPDGVLLADVAVDPKHQGRGLGRRVLSAALRRLAATPDRSVYLNVTEGNDPAVKLYLSLGFVRTLGPSQDWYNRRVIPVAP
jgi:prepilin-type processing-associated H-X9-DG protein